MARRRTSRASSRRGSSLTLGKKNSMPPAAELVETPRARIDHLLRIWDERRMTSRLIYSARFIIPLLLLGVVGAFMISRWVGGFVVLVVSILTFSLLLRVEKRWRSEDRKRSVSDSVARDWLGERLKK